jgi:hypothetical protein
VALHGSPSRPGGRPRPRFDADRRLTGFSNELKAIFIEIHERYGDPQAAADLCETIIYRLCYDARSVYDPEL